MYQDSISYSATDNLSTIEALPVWSSAAVTKFRAPQLRTSIVSRPALLQRLQSLSDQHRVTLVCAPAGFGKSTLLAQLADAEDGVESLWLSLDEDDNYPNRLFVSLLGALDKLALKWPVAPQILASQVDSGGSGARAAVAGLVNALCSYRSGRLRLIADDLHRINDNGALRLLDELIDRLPPEVGLVIGSRVEPPALSLSRWRAHAELGELFLTDLQFNESEALALANARWAGDVSPDMVRQALTRTEGWAAGLQLMFGAAGGRLASGLEFVGVRASRHLFDYFAAEVLAELPQDLRDFLLHCSILPELDPRRCAVVSGRGDARLALEELYRRNLFLTVLDDRAPVLRLHDLFRDYLQGELELRHSGLPEELHAKAAAAEPVTPRAVMHWLKARYWDEAVALILRCAEPLLAEGGYALIERWIGLLPQPISEQYPELASLQGMCRWACYDFIGMREPLERACAGFRRKGDSPNLARTLLILARSVHNNGNLEYCARLLDEADNLELDLHLRTAIHALRAWQALADGRPQNVASALHAIVDAAEADPATLYPSISDLFNGFFYGIPDTLAPLGRLRELCAAWSKQQAVHWQVEAMVHSAWPAFWHGEKTAVLAALAEQSRFQQRMAALPALWLDFHQLNGWILAAGGEFEQAVAMERRNLQIVDSVEFGSLAPSWRRVAVINLACVYWVAQDAEGLAQLGPELVLVRQPAEWPMVDTGRALVLGQIALLEGRLDEAEAELVRAQAFYQRWRLPAFMSTPAVSLALLRLAQDDPAAAWAMFEPVLAEALHEDCIGPLLLEPRQPLNRLLALIPSAERDRYQPILARLDGWQSVAAPAEKNVGNAESLLTEREIDVLQRIAAGDSNKQIARIFGLSPHTVKRHVANILAKLEVVTRGQAAAWWRDHGGS